MLRASCAYDDPGELRLMKPQIPLRRKHFRITFECENFIEFAFYRSESRKYLFSFPLKPEKLPKWNKNSERKANIKRHKFSCKLKIYIIVAAAGAAQTMLPWNIHKPFQFPTRKQTQAIIIWFRERAPREGTCKISLNVINVLLLSRWLHWLNLQNSVQCGIESFSAGAMIF